MGKREYVIRRTIQVIALYFIIATTLWALFRLAPGSPLVNFIGPGFTPAQEQQIIERFGFNEPWYVQFGKYIVNVAQFDFGFSYTTAASVNALIKDRIVNTAVLMVAAILLAYLIALPFGAYMAWNRESKFEQWGIVLTLVSRASPVFWTGIIAMWIFAIELDVAYAGGMVSPGTPTGDKVALLTNPDLWGHLWLPALVQAFYYMSLPALLMRNSMLDVLNEDYVEFAELKGIKERAVVLKHAARNAILPVVTAFAIGASHAIGGSVVIETVFDWPGIGLLLVQSVNGSDYPVAQGTFLTLAMLVILANFVADLAYGWLDPRITYE